MTAQIAAGSLDGGPLVGSLARARVQHGFVGAAAFLGLVGPGLGFGERLGFGLDFAVQTSNGGCGIGAAGLGVVDDLLFALGGRGQFAQAAFQTGNGPLDLGGVTFLEIALAFQTAQGRCGLGFGLACRFARRGQDFRLGTGFGGGPCCSFGGVAFLVQLCLGGFDGGRRFAPAVQPYGGFQGADRGGELAIA